jgi:putative tryptophan/tyrosine transport system substrate-binding protein
MSYGIDLVDVYRRSASSCGVPSQCWLVPIKYETALNLKTAKALGLAVPATLIVRADEVIANKASALGQQATVPLLGKPTC